mgnify:CR=1 FL=1
MIGLDFLFVIMIQDIKLPGEEASRDRYDHLERIRVLVFEELDFLTPYMLFSLPTCTILSFQ